MNILVLTVIFALLWNACLTVSANDNVCTVMKLCTMKKRSMCWNNTAVSLPDKRAERCKRNCDAENVCKKCEKVGDSLPTGLLAPFAGSYEPIGWVFCDGRQLSRTVYGALFGVINTNFGAGDGSTTFSIPDLRNRFPLGSTALNENGGVGGEQEVVLSTDQLPAHHHTSSILGLHPDGGQAYFPEDQWSKRLVQPVVTEDTGSNKPHNNMPPYVKVDWIIKTL